MKAFVFDLNGTMIKAAQLLQVPARDYIVFEDAPKGVEAAANAGMNAVVITTTHHEYEFENLPNIIHFAKDYTDNFFTQIASV